MIYDKNLPGRAELKEPFVDFRAKDLRIQDLSFPIEKNQNLQAYALDQVQFEKPLRLQTLMAYSKSGSALDLTSRVDASGNLTWVAPPVNGSSMPCSRDGTAKWWSAPLPAAKEM